MNPYMPNNFSQQDPTLLVNILNTMYVDNQRLIQSLTDTLHRLVESNAQIQNHLYELLNRSPPSRLPRRSNHQRTVARITMNHEPRQPDEWETISRLLQEIVSEPVVLPLTTAEIESATRRVLYSDIVRPVNTTCPISMEDFQDTDMVTVIRHCGHVFNTDPLMNWLRTNSRCPVCRHELREDNRTTETPWNAYVSSRREQPYQIYTAEGVTDISGNTLSDLFLHAFRYMRSSR